MRFVKLWIPVILWAGLILWASNDTFSADHSRGWLESMLGRQVPYAVNYTIRKLAHVVEYGILAALTWRADRRLAVVLAVAFTVAAVDETRQSTTLARSGSVWDVVLDVAGAAIAWIALRRITSPAARARPS